MEKSITLGRGGCWASQPRTLGWNNDEQRKWAQRREAHVPSFLSTGCPLGGLLSPPSLEMRRKAKRWKNELLVCKMVWRKIWKGSEQWHHSPRKWHYSGGGIALTLFDDTETRPGVSWRNCERGSDVEDGIGQRENGEGKGLGQMAGTHFTHTYTCTHTEKQNLFFSLPVFSLLTI